MSQFTCPECGSSFFGSSRNDDGTWTRHCNGYVADASGQRSCRFTWHESEDARYGLVDHDTEPPADEEKTHPRASMVLGEGSLGFATDEEQDCG